MDGVLRAVVLMGVALSIPMSGRAQTTAPALQACFVPKSGTLYIVGQPGAPDKCRSTDHVPLTWNVTGPAGAQGPAGTASLSGSTALSGIETVVASYDIGKRPLAEAFFLSTQCPVGKIAIGGGLLGYNGPVLRVNTPSGTAPLAPFVLGSYPNSAFGQSPREWIVQMMMPVTDLFVDVVVVRTVAICATVN